MECLLREGANIQAIDQVTFRKMRQHNIVNTLLQANMSALHHASKNGHQEIVKLLLKHKANANAIDAVSNENETNRKMMKIITIYEPDENDPVAIRSSRKISQNCEVIGGS